MEDRSYKSRELFLKSLAADFDALYEFKNIVMTEEFHHPALYQDGTPIRAGDRIRYHEQAGRIAFIVTANEHSPDFPKEDWPIQDGFMISFDNGALLHLTKPDSLLEFISRQF